MSFTLPHRSAATAMLIAALSLAACSSSANKTSSPSSSSAQATTAAPSTTEASSTTTVDPTLSAAAQKALLVPSDIGPDFTAGTYAPSDDKAPAPCGGANPAQRYPAILKVGSQILKGQTLVLDQEIQFYADQTTTDAIFGLDLAAVNCTNANFTAVDGSKVPITIQQPGQDVTAQTGGNKAMAWSISTTQGTVGTIIGIEDHTSVSTFIFQADNAQDAQSAPNPLDVAKKAIAKLDAA